MNLLALAKCIWTAVHSLGLISTQELSISTLNDKVFHCHEEKLWLTLDLFFFAWGWEWDNGAWEQSLVFD